MRLANVVLRSTCFTAQLEKARLTSTEGDSWQTVAARMQRKAEAFTITFFDGSYLQDHWWHTVGLDDMNEPRNVQMNRHYVVSSGWVASNLLHEAAHAYGYHHVNASESTSVPYTMNAVYDECVVKALDEARKANVPSGQEVSLPDASKVSSDLKIERGLPAASFLRSEPVPLRLEPAPEVRSNVGNRLQRFCAVSSRLSGQLQQRFPPRPVVTHALRPGPRTSGPAPSSSAMPMMEAPERIDSPEPRRRRDPLNELNDSLNAFRKAEESARRDTTEMMAPDPSRPGASAALRGERTKATEDAASRFLRSLKEQQGRCAEMRSSAPSQESLLYAAGVLHRPDLLRELEGTSQSREGLLAGTTASASLDEDTSASPPQGNLGSLESRIIDGLADFVVTRARAEAVDYLRTQLKGKLCNPATSKAAIFLPSTCVALGDLDESLSIQAAGSFLAAASMRDLRLLPTTILSRIPPVARSREQQALLLGLEFYKKSAEGRQPLEVAWSLRRTTCPGFNDDRAWFGDLDEPVCVGASLVTAIIQAQGTNVSGGLTMNTVLANFQMLMDEFARKEKNHAGGPTVSDHWTLSDAQVALLATQLRELPGLVAAVEKSSALLEATGAKNSARERLALTSRALTTLIEAARISTCVLASKAPASDATCGRGPLEDAERVADFASALFENDIPGAMAKATTFLSDGQVAMPPELRTVLPLLTEVANARSSKEVAAALEVAAAPAGSYATKYKRPAVNLNALVGLSGGVEFAGNNPGVGVLGTFAPIGMHATTPISNQFHVGLFLSVLDIGGLAQFRLAKKDTIDTEPKVGFAQVFSPGAFVTFGLFNSPFVLGLGAEVTPKLRLQRDAASQPTDTLSSVRLGGFLAVDVPLFSL